MPDKLSQRQASFQCRNRISLGRAIGVNPGRPRALTVTNPASGNAFTSNLFASHVAHQNIELQFRHVFADPLQAECQILFYRLLPALDICAVDSARIQENIREAASHGTSDLHLASHGRGRVAVAPRQKVGAVCGRAASPDDCVTTMILDSKLVSTTERAELSSISLKPLFGGQPFRLRKDSQDHVRDFPTSPHFRSALVLRGSIPGASGDAFLSPGRSHD